MRIHSTLKMTLCAALLALGSGQAYAQKATVITLRSLDGKVVMTGELQGFEAGFYNIVVAGLGLMSIPQDLVTCTSTSIDCAALVSSS